jgi:hypothetical protein
MGLETSGLAFQDNVQGAALAAAAASADRRLHRLTRACLLKNMTSSVY